MSDRPRIRHGEVVHVRNEPYTYAGEERFRSFRVIEYTASCSGCGANTSGTLLSQVRAWGRGHVCQPDTDSELPR